MYFVVFVHHLVFQELKKKKRETEKKRKEKKRKEKKRKEKKRKEKKRNISETGSVDETARCLF